MATAKKVGQRVETYDGESDSEVLKKAKTLLRVNFGSGEPLEVIRKMMLERGVEAGPLACAAVLAIVESRVDACRKAVFPRIDEVIKRLEGTNVREVIP